VTSSLIFAILVLEIEGTMKLNGLHILLTYQCTYECDHCFVWGSPRQNGTLSLEQIERILNQARDAGVEWIYFEGGEPFLYYAILVEGVKIAAGMGFHVGVVSNAYWATTIADAEEWLKPLAVVEDFTVSSDLFHCKEELGEKAQNALAAARWLSIPTGLISIAQPGLADKDQGEVMYRGRAASQLSPRAKRIDYRNFTKCPYEDLREPERVHLDPLGNVHICQGIVIGNVFEQTLKEICDEYSPDEHPVCGPLLHGGPLALVEEYNLTHEDAYADACHLCYSARFALRQRISKILEPDQMYGVGL
jgi:MoaA/NifB/PqqE/SkfB family radical SAM enzyme